MNFLAHALLAGDHAGYLVGGMAGDFVKGRLAAHDDSPVVRGVRLHRAIDRFTDAHPVCRRARQRFPQARQRVAGIVTDMIFDHFLARDWASYHASLTLEAFAAHVYHTLEAHRGLLPPSFASLLPRIRQRNWLVSYRELACTEAAITGIGRRMPRAGALLLEARDDIPLLYADLSLDFQEFFPQLVEFSRQERERLGAAGESDPDVPVTDATVARAKARGDRLVVGLRADQDAPISADSSQEVL